MTTVAATISITSAIVTPTSHGLERRTNKPVSAAISNAAAVNSAIRPYPCDVIIGAPAALGEGQEPESTRKYSGDGRPLYCTNVGSRRQKRFRSLYFCASVIDYEKHNQ